MFILKQLLEKKMILQTQTINRKKRILYTQTITRKKRILQVLKWLFVLIY